MLGCQIAGIGLLQESNSRVLPQARIDLSATGIYRNHARGASLQEAIGKTSCGGANVETHFAAHINGPVVESLFQLETAAADVLQLLAEKPYLGVLAYRSTGLLNLLFIDQYISGEDHGLRAFAGRDQAACEQEFIETCFQAAPI